MKTQQMPDGGAFNMYAYWWRCILPIVGSTWLVVHYVPSPRSWAGHAVVDDFGDLVAVPYAH